MFLYIDYLLRQIHSSLLHIVSIRSFLIHQSPSTIRSLGNKIAIVFIIVRICKHFISIIVYTFRRRIYQKISFILQGISIGSHCLCIAITANGIFCRNLQGNIVIHVPNRDDIFINFTCK